LSDVTEDGSSRVSRVLARRAGQDGAAPADELDVAVDRVILDPEGALMLADAFHRTAKRVREGLGERVLAVDGGRLGRKERPRLLQFLQETGAGVALDPGLGGWPSQVAVEEGYVGADDVVCAFDPEVGALGGLGTVVFRTSPDHGASLLRRRTLPVTVPETLVVELEGRLKRWVGPFDLAALVFEALGGRDGAAGRMIEFSGPALATLPVDDRMTLCATLARAGLSAVVPPDAVTRTWLAARRPDGVEGQGEEASPPSDLTIDASQVPLTARLAPWPGRALETDAEDGPPVQQVILAGRLADLRQASFALAERPLHPGLHLVVIPASRRVLVQALEEGLITAFVRAGAAILPPGSTPPPAPKREIRVTTVPTGANDLMVGSSVAGASALAGRLCDPETVRREKRRTAAMR
jgi:3-isopropylmalate/(R)-2-methylmalate dehydratase large subunit